MQGKSDRRRKGSGREKEEDDLEEHERTRCRRRLERRRFKVLGNGVMGVRGMEKKRTRGVRKWEQEEYCK